MNRFTDRSAVVTGAASGIGAAIATALAREGASVLWVDRAPEVEEVAARHEGRSLIGDVTDNTLPRQVLEAVGPRGVDHLIGAAGIQVRATGAEIAEEDWQRLLAVNLSGLYRLIRVLLPALTAGTRGEPGSVLAVTSMSADRAVPGIVPYGSVKAAVSHLVRGLAVELGPTGVRLNGIAPGYVATPMTAPVLEDPKRLEAIMGRLPLKRIGDPEDMAGPALFLLSDHASYVTGQILAVDGGYALT
jgi:NAD(P)-dependent dehydrogenase (short-subunit alcohol dehydrogenase family)